MSFTERFYGLNATRFQRASVNFYLISLLSYTIGSPFNLFEYFNKALWDFVIIDILGFIIIYTAFFLFLYKRLTIKQNSTIYVYTLLLNLSLSIWFYNVHRLDVTGNILMNTFMFSINIAVAGFCIGRKHALITAGMFVVLVGPLFIITDSAYLKHYSLFILFLIVAFSFALSEFSKILERSFNEELEYKDQLLAKDKAIAEEQEKLLSYKLQCQQREIISKTMFLIDHAENNNDFIKRLDAFKTKLKSTERKVLEEIIEVHRIEHHNIYWKEFEAGFIEIHPEYYRNLNKICSDLSPAENKLATLIHIGLSSKQIAALFNNTSESVDVARSRLRKKLNLANDVNLVSFLRNV